MSGRIALMLVGVNDLNCGGAERFFADFFSRYEADQRTENRLYFFTDRSTARTMSQLGKLRTRRRVVLLSNLNNRFKNLIEPVEFAIKLIAKRIEVVHVTSYTSAFYPRLAVLRKMPRFVRPRLVVSIVSCELPYALGDQKHFLHKEYADKYLHLFRTVKIDAILSWYQKVIDFLAQNQLIPGLSVSEAFVTRYSDLAPSPQDNVPKERIIVWAARLDVRKQPFMFLKAIDELKTRGYEFQGWRFEIYGDGPLANGVKEFIADRNLSSLVKYKGGQALEAVFARSTCFVSTQDYENFPSMSMMEAMHFGNAVISRNVGQTSLMVKDGKNGFLIRQDNETGLADRIAEFINSPHLHKAMGAESIRLTTEVHTYRNFVKSIDAFWNKVIAAKRQSAGQLAYGSK